MRMVTTENGVIKPKDEIQELSFVRADELDSMQLEKPFFLVKKILPVGLCIVASPPDCSRHPYISQDEAQSGAWTAF